MLLKKKVYAKRPTIGLLLTSLEENFQSHLWSSISDIVKEFHINLIVIVARPYGSPHPEDLRHLSLYDMVGNERLDGLIIMANTIGEHLSKEELTNLCRTFTDIPIVTLARKIEGIPAILIDNKRGINEALNHLISEHKYSRIAFIKGPSNSIEANERFEAYREALAAHKIPFDEELIFDGDFIYHSGVNTTRLLFEEKKVKVDAIVASNDEMALGVYRQLRHYNLKVPKDIALVGFDNIQQEQSAGFPLTSIKQPFYEMALKSIYTIIDLIKGKNVPPQIELPSRLIIRQSCGCFSRALSGLCCEKDKKAGKKSTKKRIDDIEHDKSRIIKKLLTPFIVPANKMLFLSQWVNDLLSSYSDYLKKRINAKEFLYTVSELPVMELTMELDALFWQELISRANNIIIEYIDDKEMISKIRLLSQQVITYIEELLLRPHAENSVEHLRTDWALREISKKLLSSFELKELLNTIGEELPRLGIDNTFICFFQGRPIQEDRLKWSAPEYSKLFYHFDKESKLILDSGYTLFHTKELFPDRLLFGPKRYSKVLMPIYLDENRHGYIIFEQGSKSKIVYETLRTMISSGLKAAFNVEELKRTKTIAERANRSKSAFLANMSHEIRTPLNSILGFTAILLEGEKSAKKRDYLNTVNQSGNSLLYIINDILDLSKIEAGRIDFESIVFPVEELFKQIYNMFSLKAKEKKIKLTITKDETVPNYLLGDEYRLYQILLNLTGNAIKFTKEGYITLEYSYNMGTLMIKVIDTGIGIPLDKQEEIFSPFSQVDASTTRRYGGTGLGLAITYQLVTLMKGSINVVSKPGTGTAFTLRIPFPQPEQELVESYRKKQEEKENNLKNKKDNLKKGRDFKVLVAEDDHANQSLLDVLLKKCGLAPEYCDNGEEALKMLKKNRYNLLLLDMQMPIMDGMETLKHIKDNREWDELYIIALTAHALKGAERKFILAGCNDYVSKPINVNSFVKKINELISHHR